MGVGGVIAAHCWKSARSQPQNEGCRIVIVAFVVMASDCAGYVMAALPLQVRWRRRGHHGALLEIDLVAADDHRNTSLTNDKTLRL